MTGSHVKNCLFVLIQHNCVQPFSTPRKGSTDKTVTQYMAIFDNIINRMRFSKFLSIVKGDHGPEAEALFEGLLRNGRLTFEQLVERSISKEQHMDQAMREITNQSCMPASTTLCAGITWSNALGLSPLSILTQKTNLSLLKDVVLSKHSFGTDSGTTTFYRTTGF